MSLRFRNVDVDPDTPVSAWPLEALRAAVERGNIETYRHLAREVRGSPWGLAARRIEEVLAWTQPYGAAHLLRRAIENARAAGRRRESEWVSCQLRAALRASGLSQADFARELGTSASRLSTYLSGSVTPAATMLARARSIAEAAPKGPS